MRSGCSAAGGFDGFVVSDYDAWANILKTHHFTKDMEGAAAVGINAGTSTSTPFWIIPRAFLSYTPPAYAA